MKEQLLNKERLVQIASIYGKAPSLHESQMMAQVILAAYEQEPIADVVAWQKEGEERTCDIRLRRFDLQPGPLFANPVPAIPNVIPDKMTADYAWGNLGIGAEDCSAWADGWNARAAILASAPKGV